jgi:chromosome segregation ATPase
MRLRRLLLLQPHAEVGLENGTATLNRDGSDWDVLAELDRLRTTNSGLSAEVQRQTQVGQDYARVASEERLRVEELERENAIAHTNAQMLDRRVTQAEERAAELEELVDALRVQRDRIQTYFEQQKDRADRAESASAAMREAAGELLSASDRQTHGARAKVEFADSLAKLRRSLERDSGKGFLAPAIADDVRRYFTANELPQEEKSRLGSSIKNAFSTEK